MKEVIGDIFMIAPKTKGAVIIHGANCKKTMGAGVAKMVRYDFPDAWNADNEDERTPNERFGDFTAFDYENFTIVNAYTQFNPGKNVSYMAIRTALTIVKDKYSGRPFFVPRIGAGIAGGDWDRIKGIMEEVFEGEDLTIVTYDK